MTQHPKYIFIFALAAYALSGCVYQDTVPCPPLSMSLDIQEAIYETDGYDDDMSCPPDFVDPNTGKTLGELIPTLYCVLRDYNTGKIVRKVPMTYIPSNESSHSISFDDELPYGKYILTAWGGIDNESQLDSDATCLDLSALGHEMYLINDTIDYRYSHDSATCSFKKLNGMVVIETLWETFPEGFDSSAKTFYGVRSAVNNNFEYAEIQDIEVSRTWSVDNENKVISHNILPPSNKVNGTKLHIRYFKSSDPDSPGIVPDDIMLTVRRNSITYIRYKFDPYANAVRASIYVNGHWQEINNMKVD